MRWYDEYLQEVSSQIRVKRIRQPLMAELEDHLELQKEAFLSEGLGEKEAQKRAIDDMGDALLVGSELDKVHRPQFQWRGILLSLFFIILGLLLQQILSDGRIMIPGNNSFFACLSAGVIVLVASVDYTVWQKLTFPALALWVLLLYSRIGLRGMNLPHILRVTVFQITPECLCVAAPLLTAFLVTVLRGRRYGALCACCIPPFLAALLSVHFDNTGWNYNAMSLLALTAFGVLFISIERGFFSVHHRRTYVLLAIPALLTLAFFLKELFLNLSMIQEYVPEMLKLISAARLLGRGAEVADLKPYMCLYPDSSEALFPLLIHRFGWLPFALLTLGIIAILALLIHAFVRMENRMGSLLGLSAVVTLCVQTAVYYLYSFTNYTQYVGLPLISYGSALLTFDAVLIGVILSALRGQNLPEPALLRGYA